MSERVEVLQGQVGFLESELNARNRELQRVAELVGRIHAHINHYNKLGHCMPEKFMQDIEREILTWREYAPTPLCCMSDQIAYPPPTPAANTTEVNP